MRPTRAVLMWMSALMVTSPITVVQTQSALTQWDPSLVLANQGILLCLLLRICYFSSQASRVGQPTAGAGTLTSAAWAATPSVATPAPGPRPPPASASTTPGHTPAGHAALGARSETKLAVDRDKQLFWPM